MATVTAALAAITTATATVHASGDDSETATATAAATATASGQKTSAAGTVNSGVTSQDADGTEGNNQNAGATRRAQARHDDDGDTAVTALGTQRGIAAGGKQDAATQRCGRPVQPAAVVV